MTLIGSSFRSEGGMPGGAVGSRDGNDHDRAIAAHSDLCVLITSDHSGARNEYARSIHSAGPRRSGPFVEFDCGLSNMAGDRQRPTAAVDDDVAASCRHRFHAARGGTLFLDRIELMGQDVQALLMSLLSERVLRRGVPVAKGDGEPRIIAGATRSLITAISVGTFNEALFYRLNAVHIDITSGHRREEPMKVRDLMSTAPHTCRPDADLGQIAHVMWDHDCGFVPLIDGLGRVAGVITDRDICIATATRHRSPESISAAETMAGPVYTCGPDDGVSEALATMKEYKVRRLPVVNEHGQLLGVISMNDVVLASAQKRQPSTAEVVSAIAAICAHRTAEGRATSGV
jgi:CBS domain-containing protein